MASRSSFSSALVGAVLLGADGKPIPTEDVVTSAGNSDNDIQFDEFYPSSYDYPNLLTVGAVDLAGDETSFTSLGKVDVYGNGFEVDSYVPGGNRIPFNGTSMSSPQVVNLAGKLLAPDSDTGNRKDDRVCPK